MNPFPDLFAPLVPLVIGAVVLASVLCAQSPPAANAERKALDPAVDALLTKVVAARAPKAGAKQTIAVDGKYSVAFGGAPEPVAGGAYRELFDGVSLVRTTSDMGGMGTMEKGQYADQVWENDPHMGAKVLRGAHAAAVRRYFALLRGDDPRPLYRAIEKTGTQALDGIECTVLRLTPAEGKPDTWFVEANGDVRRVDTALPAPESADAAFGMNDLVDARLTFAEWTAFDGGRFAKQRTLAMGPATVTTKCESVVFGSAIDAAKFAPPEAVTKVKNPPLKPAMTADGKPDYQIVERDEQLVASIRCKIKPGEISTQLAILLPEVMQHLVAVGAKMAGAPFSRYHAFTADEIDIEAGIPVQKAFEEKGRVKLGKLPAGKTAMCWHVGPYEGLSAAHEGLQRYLTANRLKAKGGVWEIYWTDPGMVPDKSKWKTQLFAPIE
jgi:effector-binding domain-containing protein